MRLWMLALLIVNFLALQLPSVRAETRFGLHTGASYVLGDIGPINGAIGVPRDFFPIKNFVKDLNGGMQLFLQDPESIINFNFYGEYQTFTFAYQDITASLHFLTLLSAVTFNVVDTVYFGPSAGMLYALEAPGSSLPIGWWGGAVLGVHFLGNSFFAELRTQMSLTSSSITALQFMSLFVGYHFIGGSSEGGGSEY